MGAEQHLEEAGSRAYEVNDVQYLLADRYILRDVSFEAPCGESVVVAGPSGSGKSTLLKLLVRLLELSSGAIKFFGEDIRSFSPPYLRSRAAYVPQAPALGPVSVEENLRLGPSFKGRTITEAAIQGLLEEVALPVSYLQRNTRGLSGGEQYRLSVAMALSLEPDVLLLDEPTANLDPDLSLHFGSLISRRAERGMTSLVVTHDMEFIARLRGCYVFLEEGRQVASGSIADVLQGGEGKALWDAIRDPKKEGVAEEGPLG